MSNTRDFNTKAIILKKYKVAENDLSFLMLTEKFGKINVWMKGIRKKTQKFGAYPDLFSILELEIYSNKNNEKNILKNVKILDYNYDIRLSLEKLELGAFILEIVNKMNALNSGMEIFDLTSKSFIFLNNCKIDLLKLKYFRYSFLFSFLAILGYKFELEKCVSCNLQVPYKIKAATFSFNDGGILCNNCRQKIASENYSNLFQLNRNLLQLLKKFYRINIFEVDFFKIFNDDDNLTINSQKFDAFIKLLLRNYE